MALQAASLWRGGGAGHGCLPSALVGAGTFTTCLQLSKLCVGRWVSEGVGVFCFQRGFVWLSFQEGPVHFHLSDSSIFHTLKMRRK